MLVPSSISKLTSMMSYANALRPFYALRRRCWCPRSTNICSSATHYLNACSRGEHSRYSVMAVSFSSAPKMSSARKVSRSEKKKALRELPETVLRHKLDLCSKNNDLREAIRLYDDARLNGVPLFQDHYNRLLYLCSSSSSPSGGGNTSLSESINDEDRETRVKLGLERGFEIYEQMCSDKIAPNEAIFTNMARLAAIKEDHHMAFELVKQMKSYGILPRLRSYGPALFGFCKNGDADGAYEVESHMFECGVVAEEPELSALLKVSVDARRPEKVYEMLHKLRAGVRQVTQDTARIMEDWFKSEDGSEVGTENLDVGKVKEAVIKGGGGWHGLGWLGSGKWRVVNTEVDEMGMCRSCGEKLVCIDIDPKETEIFASSLAKLACQREVKSEFVRFQEWLERHGPFDAVIDGANVSLVNKRSFNYFQLNRVVNELREISPSKKSPLVVLHRKKDRLSYPCGLVVLHRGRVFGGPAKEPRNKKLLDAWKLSGSLYVTPQGSNDDWYWLYAAVSSKCLVVTNDEMRDHLFQLLGNSFFPRWKEKHQVRLTVSTNGLKLRMPPPYSSVIQESEEGSWHIPTVTGDDLESPRQWLCVTRTGQISSKAKEPLSQLFSVG